MRIVPSTVTIAASEVTAGLVAIQRHGGRKIGLDVMSIIKSDTEAGVSEILLNLAHARLGRVLSAQLRAFVSASDARDERRRRGTYASEQSRVVFMMSSL